MRTTSPGGLGPATSSYDRSAKALRVDSPPIGHRNSTGQAVDRDRWSVPGREGGEAAESAPSDLPRSRQNAPKTMSDIAESSKRAGAQLST